CAVAALAARPAHLRSFPTRRSSDLASPCTPFTASFRTKARWGRHSNSIWPSDSTCARQHGRTSSRIRLITDGWWHSWRRSFGPRSEEHTSELQSRENLVCRLLLEKK